MNSSVAEAAVCKVPVVSKLRGRRRSVFATAVEEMKKLSRVSKMLRELTELKLLLVALPLCHHVHFFGRAARSNLLK